MLNLLIETTSLLLVCEFYIYYSRTLFDFYVICFLFIYLIFWSFPGLEAQLSRLKAANRREEREKARAEDLYEKVKYNSAIFVDFCKLFFGFKQKISRSFQSVCTIVALECKGHLRCKLFPFKS